jgi:hypothetical protein
MISVETGRIMGKEEADYLKKIEMWWLKENGFLIGYKSSSIVWSNRFADRKDSIGITVSTMDHDRYVRLCYTTTSYDGDKTDFDYKIRLTTTPCYFGGERYWFVCPLSTDDRYCGRRVGVLYKGGNYFGCRHCYDLTYMSKKVNRRHGMGPLFQGLALEERIADLEANIKTRYYGGKPTRKQRRLDDLYDRLGAKYALL